MERAATCCFLAEQRAHDVVAQYLFMHASASMFDVVVLEGVWCVEEAARSVGAALGAGVLRDGEQADQGAARSQCDPHIDIGSTVASDCRGTRSRSARQPGFSPAAVIRSANRGRRHPFRVGRRPVPSNSPATIHRASIRREQCPGSEIGVRGRGRSGGAMVAMPARSPRRGWSKRRLRRRRWGTRAA